MSDSKLPNSKIDIYAHETTERLLADFRAAAGGLSSRQADENRLRYGDNNLLDNRADSVMYRLRRAFVNPFSIILLVLAVISCGTELFLKAAGQADLSTSIIIACMLVLSGTVRFIQELRAKAVSDKLLSMVKSENLVKRDGEWRIIPSEEIVVGDTVALRAGDRVPAEMRLIKTSDLFVSQSMLTGESAILEKNTEPLVQQNVYSYSDYKNIAFTGSAVIGGTGEGVVIAVGRDTVFGAIKEKTSSSKSGFDKGAASIAGVLVRYMCVLVPIVFLATGITKGDWGTSILFALSVGVGLTPELLPMVVNACLAKGATAMSRKQTIVKNLGAMQGFGSMDLLCVDKTGTLTGDKILLEYYMDIFGNECNRTLEVAYLNSAFHSGVKNHLDEAVLRAEEMPGREEYFETLLTESRKLDEIPFDYDRKMVSVLVENPAGKTVLVKGNISEVTARCDRIEYKGNVLPIEGDKSGSVQQIVEDMLDDGMKVLAVAYKPFDKEQLEKSDESGLILLGYLAFFDAPKESAASALQKLAKLNVSTKVMTGDEDKVAVSICRRLGLDTKNRLTGSAFERLTEEEQILAVEDCTVFSELTPRQKSHIVRLLRENGHAVGFLGDGMNDLPAIVEADVGISVDQASDVVKEASDVILLKKDLNVLEAGILEGRKAFANTRKYIKITASSNFGNILSIVAAGIFLPFLPMTSLQLLLLNLLYDLLCLILPWDNVDEDSYSIPQEWSGKNLGRFMRHFGPLSSVFDLLTFAFLYFILCPELSGGDSSTFVALFQTGWFLESMWTQVLILHLLRTRKLPFAESRPAASVIIVTVLGVILFTMLSFTGAGAMFGLAGLSLKYAGFLIVTVLGYMLLVSVVKIHYVRKYHELT